MGNQTVYLSQWGPSSVSDFLQNDLFCVQQKKVIHTGLEKLWWQTEFSFLGELSL